MIHSLPLFHRIDGAKVVVVGEGAMGEAKARLVRRAGGIPVSEAEAHHARLAFVALDDERQAKAAALRLKRAGLLVNVADRPELCDFTTPSILERSPVLIAVSTGGASAGLAKHLRLRLERIIPQSLGTLATALSDAREKLRARYPAPDDRRRMLDGALAEGGALDIMREGSHEAVDGWLADDAAIAGSETHTINLRSDDPEDLTLREARLLGEADVIIHDPNVPEAILSRARADAERFLVGGEDTPAPGGGLTVRLCTQV
ncbi:precorrin-2 dehydrogenase/sirohydrochlorin ferrochelatase family protein [Qipengyuania atrilutea]|uniref:precorrin-2 dehydrogenase n=1 Tax=Qipengyuania atrilutea TaxID=2744473 RepID=A0A850H978_9SPHN|nr:bifunctional precorrin-2 dehydrogenase/sirohydrochlorin ferrochelatase [Actirhodobacter atriluteus]NVD45845.1 siroheme synthase [Actirhodobacter atriluteus]